LRRGHAEGLRGDDPLDAITLLGAATANVCSLSETGVLTSLANGKSVTQVSRDIDQDMLVTDNGDGTLTILAKSVGVDVLYSSDGEVLARNPGQTRVEVLIDHGGTPSDPSDDEFLEFLGVVKGSTGRNDDFCAAIEAELS
jgi:hypothetical protein